MTHKGLTIPWFDSSLLGEVDCGTSNSWFLEFSVHAGDKRNVIRFCFKIHDDIYLKVTEKKKSASTRYRLRSETGLNCMHRDTGASGPPNASNLFFYK